MRLLVAIAALLAGLTVNVAPAAAADVVRLELNGHPTTVTTSNGHSLHLTVAAFKDISTGNTDKVAVNVTLSTGKAVGFGETHRWSFPAPRAALIFHQRSGKGTLATGAALGTYGTLDLSFTSLHRSVEHCELGGSETSWTGTLRGSVHFRSSSSWGRVNDKHIGFTTHNEVVVDRGCEEEEEDNECHESVSWVGPSGTVPAGTSTQYGSAFFSGGPKTPQVLGVRTVSLTSPRGAGRVDYLVAATPAPQANGNTLSITTKPGTRVTGSATISGGQPTPAVSDACDDDATGTQKTETTGGYFGASWSSPADDPMTFNFSAGPDFSAPLSGSSSWTQSTFS